MRTLHLVQVSARMRGTWSNPVVEIPRNQQLHERRMSPARLLVELLQGERDWPLWELQDSDRNFWPLGTARERNAVIRMIAEDTDLRHGWNQPPEWHHPAFQPVGEPLALAYRYDQCWEYIKVQALTEAA